MNLKVMLPDGKIIIDQTFENMTRYTVFKTPSNKGRAPTMDVNALKMSFQDKIVEDNMAYIHDYFNDYLGYTKLNHTAIVYRVDSKEYDYQSLQDAYEKIVSGYNALSTDYNKAISKINEAIAIWESELKNYDPLDKKSRINSDIAIAINFNLYDAYLWSGNYDKAEEHLSKIIGLNPSKKQKALVQEYCNFLKNMRNRGL